MFEGEVCKIFEIVDDCPDITLHKVPLENNKEIKRAVSCYSTFSIVVLILRDLKKFYTYNKKILFY